MDNGLIFPYRRSGAHDEPGDANHPKPSLSIPFGGERVGQSVGSDPVVVKRWGDAGR
jgi:hypothetical protein